MMRRARNHGFFVSLLINMLFRMEWLILTVLLLVLHFIFHIGWWWSLIPVVCWVIHSLLVTVIVSAAVRLGNEPTPKRENKNPYSHKGPVR